MSRRFAILRVPEFQRNLEKDKSPSNMYVTMVSHISKLGILHWSLAMGASVGLVLGWKVGLDVGWKIGLGVGAGF